jgi:hypothetical protein
MPSTAAPTHRFSWPTLFGALLLLSLVLRVGIVLLKPPSVEGTLTLLNDSTDYDLLARHVLEGRGFTGPGGNPSVLRPPLYPLFMAFVYLLAGSQNLLAVGLAQAFIGMLTTALCIGTARLLGARGPWCLLAGLAHAIYPVFIFQTTTILTETLFQFLHLLAITSALLAGRQTRRLPWFLCGILFAIAALCRPAALATGVITAAWCLFSSRGSRSAKLQRSLLLLTGIALSLSPWITRNYRITGEFIPVASNLPVTLVHGTSRLSVHASRWFDAEKELIPVSEELLWHTQLRAFNSAAEELEQQRHYKQQWQKFARENPADLLYLSFRRTLQFWSPFIQNDSRFARLAAFISMTPILIGGWLYILLALVISRKHPLIKRAALLCMAVAVISTLPHALSMPDVRYRTALMDPLWIAATAAAIRRLRR